MVPEQDPQLLTSNKKISKIYAILIARKEEMQSIFLSKEGLEKLKNELHKLKTVSRKEVAERIKDAKSYGDLSENSEYEDAKEQQAFVEGRIQELENMIRNAKIVVQNKSDKVSLGSKVTVQNDGEKLVLILVDRTASRPSEGKISYDSPLGAALMGKTKGEEVEVKTPSGSVKYKIKAIG